MISLSVRALLIAVASTLVLSAQPSAAKTAAERKALYDAHHGDFDYLLGNWEFTVVSPEYRKGRGYWRAVRLDTG